NLDLIFCELVGLQKLFHRCVVALWIAHTSGLGIVEWIPVWQRLVPSRAIEQVNVRANQGATVSRTVGLPQERLLHQSVERHGSVPRDARLLVDQVRTG